MLVNLGRSILKCTSEPHAHSKVLVFVFLSHAMNCGAPRFNQCIVVNIKSVCSHISAKRSNYLIGYHGGLVHLNLDISDLTALPILAKI